ncbi:MAG: antibiotic biosynthesis monooxygenase [Gammaproteobacteria bacterium]
MVTILGRVRIEDLPAFISVFATRGQAMRRQHGSRSAQLFKVDQTPDEVVVVFDWSSREDFERFTTDPAVRETMKSSGTRGAPEFTVLERVATFPG